MDSQDRREVAEFAEGFDDVSAGWGTWFKSAVSSYLSNTETVDGDDLSKANDAASWVNDKLSQGASYVKSTQAYKDVEPVVSQAITQDPQYEISHKVFSGAVDAVSYGAGKVASTTAYQDSKSVVESTTAYKDVSAAANSSDVLAVEHSALAKDVVIVGTTVVAPEALAEDGAADAATDDALDKGGSELGGPGSNVQPDPVPNPQDPQVDPQPQANADPQPQANVEPAPAPDPQAPQVDPQAPQAQAPVEQPPAPDPQAPPVDPQSQANADPQAPEPEPEAPVVEPPATENVQPPVEQPSSGASNGNVEPTDPSTGPSQAEPQTNPESGQQATENHPPAEQTVSPKADSEPTHPQESKAEPAQPTGAHLGLETHADPGPSEPDQQPEPHTTNPFGRDSDPNDRTMKETYLKGQPSEPVQRGDYTRTRYKETGTNVDTYKNGDIEITSKNGFKYAKETGSDGTTYEKRSDGWLRTTGPNGDVHLVEPRGDGLRQVTIKGSDGDAESWMEKQGEGDNWSRVEHKPVGEVPDSGETKPYVDPQPQVPSSVHQPIESSGGRPEPSAHPSNGEGDPVPNQRSTQPSAPSPVPHEDVAPTSKVADSPVDQHDGGSVQKQEAPDSVDKTHVAERIDDRDQPLDHGPSKPAESGGKADPIQNDVKQDSKADGSHVEEFHDGDGQLIGKRVTDAEGNIREERVDSSGKTTETYERRVDGSRVETRWDSSGGQSSEHFDRNGNLTRRIESDGDGNLAERQYGKDGRLNKEVGTRGDGSRYEINYDRGEAKNGTQWHENGSVTKMENKGQGLRKFTETAPDGSQRTWHEALDSGGNVRVLKGEPLADRPFTKNPFGYGDDTIEKDQQKFYLKGEPKVSYSPEGTVYKYPKATVTVSPDGETVTTKLMDGSGRTYVKKADRTVYDTSDNGTATKFPKGDDDGTESQHWEGNAQKGKFDDIGDDRSESAAASHDGDDWSERDDVSSEGDFDEREQHEFDRSSDISSSAGAERDYPRPDEGVQQHVVRESSDPERPGHTVRTAYADEVPVERTVIDAKGRIVEHTVFDGGAPDEHMVVHPNGAVERTSYVDGKPIDRAVTNPDKSVERTTFNDGDVTDRMVFDRSGAMREHTEFGPDGPTEHTAWGQDGKVTDHVTFRDSGVPQQRTYVDHVGSRHIVEYDGEGKETAHEVNKSTDWDSVAQHSAAGGAANRVLSGDGSDSQSGSGDPSGAAEQKK